MTWRSDNESRMNELAFTCHLQDSSGRGTLSVTYSQTARCAMVFCISLMRSVCQHRKMNLSSWQTLHHLYLSEHSKSKLPLADTPLLQKYQKRLEVVTVWCPLKIIYTFILISTKSYSTAHNVQFPGNSHNPKWKCWKMSFGWETSQSKQRRWNNLCSRNKYCIFSFRAKIPSSIPPRPYTSFTPPHRHCRRQKHHNPKYREMQKNAFFILKYDNVFIFIIFVFPSSCTYSRCCCEITS